MIGLFKQKLRPVKEAARLYLNYPYDTSDLEWPTYWEWHSKHAKRLLKFKAIHRGESCFIIGNGPSLRKMDLSLLKHHHTFGLNKIYLMFDKVDLDLSYHVAINPLVIEQSIKEFESLTCPSFLSYKPSRKNIRQLEHIYFLLTKGPYTFQTNLLEGVFEGYTVTYVAMQLAFYMGFSQVFLIGVDHSFTAVGNPNEKQILQGEDLNHFSPKYFANKEWQLPDLETSELSYNLAKYHFNQANRQIYDATVDGKLTIFPKISFEQALEMCTQKVKI